MKTFFYFIFSTFTASLSAHSDKKLDQFFVIYYPTTKPMPYLKENTDLHSSDGTYFLVDMCTKDLVDFKQHFHFKAQSKLSNQFLKLFTNKLKS